MMMWLMGMLHFGTHAAVTPSRAQEANQGATVYAQYKLHKEADEAHDDEA
jgi:hypothetical protein